MSHGSKSDSEASKTCDALDALLQERMVNNSALRQRLLPLPTDSSDEPLSSDYDTLNGLPDPAARALNDRIKRELYISRAYGGHSDNSASATSTDGHPSLRTTTTADTLYSILSALRVPVAESELSACLPESEHESAAMDRVSLDLASDWHVDGLKTDRRGAGNPTAPGGRGSEVSADAEASLPLWGAPSNSDSAAGSPWARKIILSLGQSRIKPAPCRRH